MLSFRAFKILFWSVDGGGHQNIYNVFIRRDLMPYIGLVLHWKFIANFCQLFVIFQFCENFNVWSLIYVFGKYFDSLNLANFELRIMAKCGQIYCTGIMICKLCVVHWFPAPCIDAWQCLSPFVVYLCGVNVVYLWRLLIWDWWFLSFLSTALPEHGGWLWEEGRPIHSTLSQSLGADILLVAW